MRVIAANIRDWPRQWQRELDCANLSCVSEEFRAGTVRLKWQFAAESLRLITEVSESLPDIFFSGKVAGRTVICELLNAFPGLAFPNAMQLHSSIKFGIRPLL
jgi:hypothetical protein